MNYRIFTISSGEVTNGALVETYDLSGANVSIPAIIVGERGRGRSLGILPVELPKDLYREWKQNGAVTIQTAKVGKTKAGKSKLFACFENVSNDKIIAVFRTKIGYRGSNSHTGDRIDEKNYKEFPGQILASGWIAQGAAGRMGYGQQLVTLVPKGVVFRTGYSGRLYGGPDAHYYRWDGQELTSLTWQEREISDLF